MLPLRLPSWTALLTALLLLALPGLGNGCRRPAPAEQAAAQTATITAIRAQFPADPSAEQADALEKPAKHAAKAYAALLALQKKHPQDTAVASAQTQAEPLVAEIRRLHRLATERRDLAALMGGLKVRAYRAARDVAVPRLLEALAAAARQAAETDLDSLPRFVREAAELAAALADITPVATATDSVTTQLTREDWLRTAERIDCFNRAEPPEFALCLGLAYTVLGKTGFAFVELDRVDRATFAQPTHAALVPLARAFALSRVGFTQLAALEASKLSGDTEQGRQLLAAIHAVLAYCHAAEKDWKQMDRELALTVRIWPDNPLVVFLSGERLLADGRKEEALESFARVSAGTEGAWLAPLLEKRVREVRDSRGEVPPLLLDNELFVRCALHSLIAEAGKAERGRSLVRLLTVVRLLPGTLAGDLEPVAGGAP